MAPFIALTVLGQVRARRGDPDVWGPLDRALEMAEPSGELQRLALVAAARAEAAWLAGDRQRTLEEARGAYKLAVEKRHLWFAGELAYWQWKAGGLESPPGWIAEPYARQIAGDTAGAAASWAALRLSVRGGACACGERRRGGAPRSARRLRGPRCSPSGTAHTPGSAGAGCIRATRPATGHARESRKSHSSRVGRPRPPRGRSAKRRDRRPPRRLATHGRPPCLGNPSQARREDARRSSRRGRPPAASSKRGKRSGQHRLSGDGPSRGARLFPQESLKAAGPTFGISLPESGLSHRREARSLEISRASASDSRRVSKRSPRTVSRSPITYSPCGSRAGAPPGRRGAGPLRSGGAARRRTATPSATPEAAP